MSPLDNIVSASLPPVTLPTKAVTQVMRDLKAKGVPADARDMLHDILTAKDWQKKLQALVDQAPADAQAMLADMFAQAATVTVEDE